MKRPLASRLRGFVFEKSKTRQSVLFLTNAASDRRRGEFLVLLLPDAHSLWYTKDTQAEAW